MKALPHSLNWLLRHQLLRHHLFLSLQLFVLVSNTAFLGYRPGIIPASYLSRMFLTGVLVCYWELCLRLLNLETNHQLN